MNTSESVIVSPHRRLFRQIKAIYFIIALSIGLFILAFFVHSFGVFSFDVMVTRWLQSMRSPGLDIFFEVMTFLGNSGIFLIVAIVAALYFWTIKLPKSAIIALSTLIAYPLNVFIKGVVDRVRPTSTLVTIISPAGGYSFPSGHAMITLTVYGVITYLVWSQFKSRKRIFGIIAASLLIFLIGLSRIYLGVHWFSDVLGGWIGGIALVLIFVEIHKKWLNPVKK